MNFILRAPGRKTWKDVTSSPQWDGFLYVLGTSDLKFLSLDCVENLDKNGPQRKLTRKKIEKYDNDGGSKSDQNYRSRVILDNKRW